MNLGLAAGAVAAIPVAIAAGAALAATLGGVMRWSTGLLCVGLVLEAGSQPPVPDIPHCWALTLVAGSLAGFAVARPCGRLLCDGPWLRAVVTALRGRGGVTLGLFIVSTAGFLAPLAAVALFIWSRNRLSVRVGRADPLGA